MNWLDVPMGAHDLERELEERRLTLVQRVLIEDALELVHEYVELRQTESRLLDRLGVVADRLNATVGPVSLDSLLEGVE